MTTKAYKYDAFGHPIFSGTEIIVENFSLTSSTWVAIGAGCKSFLAKARSGSNFKISDSVAGTDYITVIGSISIEVNGTSDTTTLFYAQSVDATDTLELIYTD